jgi:hypothetical protein
MYPIKAMTREIMIVGMGFLIDQLEILKAIIPSKKGKVKSKKGGWVIGVGVLGDRGWGVGVLGICGIYKQIPHFPTSPLPRLLSPAFVTDY